MRQRAKKLNTGNMISDTYRAKDYYNSWIELANKATSDTDKAERLKRHECKACFYGGRIGGATITTRPCMCCGKEEHYGSTNTDVLCLDCAKKHKLCKHCGGDIEMRIRRKDWPVAELLGVDIADTEGK